MVDNKKPAAPCARHCSSAVIAGVNDQAEWNERISEMQTEIEFEPLVEFLERLKEPVMDDLKVGDDVEVLDAGLAMLRRLCPDQPPNHHGRIEAIDGDTITVEFPIDGSYDGHSQSAPYPRSEVRKR